MRMMRSMAGWYITGMPFAARYKNELCSVSTYEDMVRIMDSYRALLSEGV